MVSWIGLRQLPVPYDRAARTTGASNYPLARMIGLAFDALTSFSIMPLRLASYLGLALGLLSFSYIMNSSITFAAESGRKFRRRDYLAFVASGIAGWIANTAMLLVAAEMLLLPLSLAKLVAILASFVVNFSLSHFVVFRARSGD